VQFVPIGRKKRNVQLAGRSTLTAERNNTILTDLWQAGIRGKQLSRTT